MARAKAKGSRAAATNVGLTIENVVPEDLAEHVVSVDELVIEFAGVCEPLERTLHVLVDARTLARFCECHIPANTLVPLSTIDVPLDPEEQQEYRANRDMVTAHQAFEDMKEDALNRRSFSNLVLEYLTDYDTEHPLKMIGGQHRYTAVEEALEKGVNEYHGVKVYFGLNLDQRLDVQLISNTVIEISPDLLDRMQETQKGPQLRDWCKQVGLVKFDFADKRQRGKEITVAAARSFVLNYHRGKTLASEGAFDQIETTPRLSKAGVVDEEFEKLRREPNLLDDPQLRDAGREFARLIEAQRRAFSDKASKNVDFAEKALNYAVLSSWAFVAGLLHKNELRLKRHFSLSDRIGKDPLNAAALAKGQHKTDSDSYRGLGYRTDAKERGRFAELFYLQAKDGDGISPAMIDVAIKKYHTKVSLLDEKKAEQIWKKNGRD